MMIGKTSIFAFRSPSVGDRLYFGSLRAVVDALAIEGCFACSSARVTIHSDEMGSE